MAFSQAELLMVVAITAITASVATIAVHKSLNNAKLQRAADKLITDLRLVRDCARREQQSYTVQFDPHQHSYTLPDIDINDGTESTTVDLTGSEYQVSDISCQLPEENAVTFDARGWASPPGSIVLSSDSRQIVINIMEGGQIEQQN